MIKARHYNSYMGARGKESQNDGDETKSYKSDCETLARPISTTGKAKQARRIGPSGSSTFSQEVRKKIFANYWSIGDKRGQRLFILRHVERHLAKKKRVGIDKKNVNFKYYLYTGDSRLQVYRHFFRNTLYVGRDFILGTIDIHSATGTLKPTKQGTHSNHRKTDETLL